METDAAITSKLTTEFQAAIPEKVRGVLELKPGDSVAFETTPDQRVWAKTERF